MRRIGIFGVFFILFAIAFCAIALFRMYLEFWPNYTEFLAAFGVWLIFSFIVVSLCIGAAQGIPNSQIQIPKKPAVTVFSIASVLFVVAIHLDIST